MLIVKTVGEWGKTLEDAKNKAESKLALLAKTNGLKIKNKHYSQIKDGDGYNVTINAFLSS